MSGFFGFGKKKHATPPSTQSTTEPTAEQDLLVVMAAPAKKDASIDAPKFVTEIAHPTVAPVSLPFVNPVHVRAKSSDGTEISTV